ncbi:hypothetical protein RY27_01995 [Litorilinea aerophila]|nr:hypothetical protein RY27_01995 [Litorilinea aerophila]
MDQVMTIAGGHFMHDSFSAFLAPLLPLLQDRLNIGYAVAGGLAIFTQLPSLLNPFIGYLADRVSLRYFVILAPGITATLMSFMGFAPDYLVLTLLLLAAGVSIAAFHAPAPAMIGRVAGQRIGTGMSIFMASGELGRTVGPVVAVAGVTWWGLEGLWRLAILGWLTSAVLYWRLRQVAARPPARRPGMEMVWVRVRQTFPVLAWIMLPKAFMVVAITTYLPIFMRDELQTSLWLAAASLTILEGAGVVGALTTGTLSDRLGRGRVLLLLLTLAPLLLLLFLMGPGWLTAPVLVALGLTAISPTPVLLAIVQDQFPDNRAAANGVFMFLNFIIRAVAIWTVGWLADHYGLMTAFWWSSLIALLSVPAVYWLPRQAETTG